MTLKEHFHEDKLTQWSNINNPGETEFYLFRAGMDEWTLNEFFLSLKDKILFIYSYSVATYDLRRPMHREICEDDLSSIGNRDLAVLRSGTCQGRSYGCFFRKRAIAQMRARTRFYAQYQQARSSVRHASRDGGKTATGWRHQQSS